MKKNNISTRGEQYAPITITTADTLSTLECDTNNKLVLDIDSYTGNIAITVTHNSRNIMDNLILDQGSIPTIRPDIARISEIQLTLAGKCWLHAFTIGTLKAGLETLKQELESNKMNEKDKWYTLFNACRNYATDRNLKVGWKTAYDLLREHNVTKDDLEYVGNKEVKTPKQTKEFTPEQWKDAPTDRIAYAHACHSFEEERSEDNKRYNPHWSYMYPSWKKRMIEKFPILREIYPKDATFCDGLEDIPDMEYPHAVTDSEHAENIIIHLEWAKGNTKRLRSTFNPWWDKLDSDERQSLLIKYPWYTQYVTKTPGAEEFFKKLAETMEVNETDEQVLT